MRQVYGAANQDPAGLPRRAEAGGKSIGSVAARCITTAVWGCSGSRRRLAVTGLRFRRGRALAVLAL